MSLFYGSGFYVPLQGASIVVSLLDIFVLTPKFSTVIMFIAAKHDAQCGTEPRLSSSEDVSSWHPKKERSTVATA